VAVLLFHSVPAPADEPDVASAGRALMAQIDHVGRRGFLYQVSKPDRPGMLFLYGTIHLGRIGEEPFNPTMLRALLASSRLALEADPSDDPTTRRIALRLGRYEAGDGLNRHVPAELLAKVEAYGQKIGLPRDQMLGFKPWLLASMVALTGATDTGLDPAMGSEAYLVGYARASHLPIVEIEGLESQLRLLADMPEALQNAQLDEALTEASSGQAETQSRDLFATWLAGDERAGDAIMADMRRDARDHVYERYFVDVLIDQRNRLMADKAESCLAEAGSTFFAVGSLHLFGDDGLIRELRRRGYRVVDLQAPVDPAH
jgi:uncharacterized protein YbaP (TraB family)